MNDVDHFPLDDGIRQTATLRFVEKRGGGKGAIGANGIHQTLGRRKWNHRCRSGLNR
ncbi:MAG: hypothetical protein RLZZ78_1604, partial [Armatimonadota bacterium]